jgi:hypothetical protein
MATYYTDEPARGIVGRGIDCASCSVRSCLCRSRRCYCGNERRADPGVSHVPAPVKNWLSSSACKGYYETAAAPVTELALDGFPGQKSETSKERGGQGTDGAKAGSNDSSYCF